ncbi:hypothetical protein F5141DRAFT_1063847 [Pisolithus sp. B1]|nr:hypothetical protein F5141DRAFT_1063847 [Pisolithus sp. B1]
MCRSPKQSLLGTSDMNIECTRNSGGRALETIPLGLRDTSPAEGGYQQLELDNVGKRFQVIVEGPCKRQGPPTEIVTRQHEDRKPIAQLRLSPAVARIDVGRNSTFLRRRQEKEALNSPTFAHREPHSSLQAGLEEIKVLMLLIVRLSNRACHREVPNIETDIAQLMCEPGRLEVPVVRDPKGNGHAASNVGQSAPCGESRRTVWEGVDT